MRKLVTKQRAPCGCPLAQVSSPRAVLPSTSIAVGDWGSEPLPGVARVAL